ncbi:MAG: flavodoxin domain-containing protein [Frankiaceae bacterium]
MRILVAVASRHGATAEMAEWIGATLREVLAGSVDPPTVDVRTVADVPDVDGYDAVVVGSAVYMGQWLDDARRFIGQHADALAARPVWLFSSGPVGDPPMPAESPETTSAMVARIAPRGHRFFAGRVEPAELGRMERMALRVVKAPAGDYRDPDAVRAWAAEIAAALLACARARV